MNKFKFYCLISGSIVFSLSTQAATLIPISDDNFEAYITPSKKGIASTNQEYSFALAKSVTLPDGLIKHKYTQLYKGIPVFSQVITSSELKGQQRDWHGDILVNISEDIKNIKPSYDSTGILNLIKQEFKVPEGGQIQNEQARLFVRMNEKNKAQLIYLVSFYVESDKPMRPFYIVDAHTGRILSSWDGLTTKDAQGPGGNEKVGNWYYGRDYPSLEVSDGCAMTNANVDTYDMKNQEAGGSIFRFICPVNTYKLTNGAPSPLNDGHYFAGIVFKMYREWYNISPMKTKLTVRVHFGNNYEGAFWNGQQMSFGDGGASTYPFTALDVMAHEVSHGVTEENSDLIYTKQSGGINEAFSDMAGEVAEAYMGRQAGKENDWVGGAMIIKGPPGSAMRYFKNPRQDGVSIDNLKDYNDTLNVHFSSGIYNKAFYLLSTKPNWDIKKAFSVFLLANQVYWKRDATFNDAACGVAKATNDLKYAVNDVISSFKEVGVDANCISPDPTPEPGKEIVLQNGSVVNNIAIKAGDERRYVITVPVVKVFPYSYDLLYMRLGNGKGTTSNTAELYVRYETGALQRLKPEQQAKGTAAADEIFMFKKPAAGNYHILVKGKGVDTLNLTVFYGNNGQLKY